MPNRPTIQSSCTAGSIFLTARSTTEVCHYTSYGLSKSVRSPAFFPETGSSRADSGLCHFADRLATSPIIRAKPASLMSPGNGYNVKTRTTGGRCQKSIQRNPALAPSLRRSFVFEHLAARDRSNPRA